MQTPELAVGVHVGEQFNMHADGLTAVELWPVQVGPPRGTIRFQIGMGDAGALPSVQISEVPAADLVRGQTYRFQFTPFTNSKNQRFALDVEASADEPASGIALWATKGEGNADDVLLFNDEGRFGDLVYQTEIVPPLPAPRPPVRSAVWYALGALALGWLMLVRMLRRLIAAVS